MDEVINEDVKILDEPFSDSTSLIVITQLPAFEEQLTQVKSIIDKRTAVAMQLKCTDDNRKDIKNLRANLNKEKKLLKEKYKEALAEVIAPIENVQQKFKECIAGYDKADEQLKKQIDVIETALKDEKRLKIVEYFEEYAQSRNIDFLTFDDLGITVNLSSSETSLKKQVTAFLERVATDLKMIEMQEDKDEILVEYKKSLNAADAITKVKVRKQSIEEERKRRIEQQEERERRRKAEQAVIDAAKEQEKQKREASVSDDVPFPEVEPSGQAEILTEPITAPTEVKSELPLKKFTFSFQASVEAHSKDEALEMLREFKPKLIEFMERSGIEYGK